MIIQPSQAESQYVQIPFGAPQGDYDWVIGMNPDYAQHGVYGRPPGYFRVIIPTNRVLEFSLLVFGSSGQEGLICMRYGAMPGPFSDEPPFARHGSVALDQLDNTVFQWTTNGQVVRQIFDPSFAGGGCLYGAIYGNPYALQVVMDIEDPTNPPIKIDVPDNCPKVVIRYTKGRGAWLNKDEDGRMTVRFHEVLL